MQQRPSINKPGRLTMIVPDSSEIKKILIIMMGGIGNMIFLTPALKALRRSYPSATLTFLLGPYGAEKVLQGSNLLDKTIVIDPEKTRGIKEKIKLIHRLKRENFSLSIASTGTNPSKSGLLCFLARIKYRLGENIKGKDGFYNLKIPFREDSHEVESNIALIQRLGIDIKDKRLFIQRSSEDQNFAQRIFTQHGLEEKFVVGMHPGSGIHQAGFKRWPSERFAQVADWLVEHLHAAVVIFGGPEEDTLAHDIEKMMNSSPLRMTGKTTLGQTAALIEKCNLFTSNDSGLLHVACAVQTPCVGLFGPTNPNRTGPYSESALIIRKKLSCSPCYSQSKIKCQNLDCIELLTVDEVLGATKNFIKTHIKIKNQ